MFLSMVWLLAVTAVVCLAVCPTLPPSARSRQRDRVRRVRYLRRRPAMAAYHDLESALLAEGIPAATVSDVCGLAVAGGVPAPLLWQWADRHGPRLLGLALATGLGSDDLEATLHDATGLDVESLEIWCAVYGHPLSYSTEASPYRPAAPDRSAFGSGSSDAGHRAS